MIDATDTTAVQKESERLLMELWRRNHRANRRIIPSNGGVARLFDRFSGVPAVVVGAGPSLGKSLPYLSALAGRLLVVAVDAALHPLMAAGVTPDLVVSFDPQRSVGNFFHGLITNETVLVAPTIAHPAITTKWDGQLIFYNKYAPDIPFLAAIMKETEAIGTLLPGGSVSSVALDLAVRIGADPIALAGQDLSYRPGGKTHAEQSVYDTATEEITTLRRERVVETKDIFGAPALTETNLLIYKEWMEWYFDNNPRERASPFANCTEGGIVNNGAERPISPHCQNLSLTEWMERLSHPMPHHDFRARIRELMTDPKKR